MFNVGDLVTRNSYKNDIVFEIVAINNDIFYLNGVDIRLSADSTKEDLKIYNDKFDDKFHPELEEYENLNRSEYFYLPGKILHLDGDENYLEKCMKFYKKNKIMAYGLFIPEVDMSKCILSLLKKYNPDILVLTGHDSFSRNKREKYKNTSNFIDAVVEARKYEKSHEKLFIVAGACQSDYEELIKAGANFASSPKHVNIHALDPAIVASCLSFSDKNENIDIVKILNNTKYGTDGMGGIITRGSMYIGYPR